MELDTMKNLIKKYMPGHSRFLVRVETADRYYRNKTDILLKPPKEKNQEENPLRNADNRIPFNFHGLLVNQKASYMFTAPPLFDLGTKQANKELTAFLGDKYAKTCKDLCADASNASIGWLHLWKDKTSVSINKQWFQQGKLSPGGARTWRKNRRAGFGGLALIHISEPTRPAEISYAVFFLKKKKKKKTTIHS